LPRRKPSATAATYAEKDDVTSPAHIGTAGLTFQIADRKDRAITVSIRACVFFRMLPSREDLAGSKVVFRLAKKGRAVILRHRREALRRAEDENRAVLDDEGRNSTAWLEIKTRVTEQAENAALLELGITPDVFASPARQDALVSTLAEQDEEPAADDPAVNDDPQSAAEGVPANQPEGESSAAVAALELPDRRPAAGDSDTLRAFAFAAGPDTTNPLPYALLDRARVPQKGLLWDGDVAARRIDRSRGAQGIERAVAEFTAEMQLRIERAIDAWQADDDPNTGGLLWAFPAGRGMQSR